MTSTSVAGRLRLQDKVALVFGAGGQVGASVARELAVQGALLFLSGRGAENVKRTADAVAAHHRLGGLTELDALDEAAVDRYLDNVVATAGRVDVVFNAMGPQAVDYGNATDTMALPVDKFMLPISTIVASQFITARATARYMRRQGSGVVVFLSATPSQGAPNTSAVGAAYGALESLTRSLAVDLGQNGVRVVCIRSMGMAETRMMQQTYALAAETMGTEKHKVKEAVTSRALLGHGPTLADTARLVAFLASDEAAAITGAIINSSCGQVLD
jgi:3-oxoacyl-[acyl-carrier protein] reductase